MNHQSTNMVGFTSITSRILKMLQSQKKGKSHLVIPSVTKIEFPHSGCPGVHQICYWLVELKIELEFIETLFQSVLRRLDYGD